MSGMPPKPKFPSIELYMRKLADIVRETPALAPLAYTRAAAYVRAQIRPGNKNGLELQAIACKLDEMAAMAIVGEVEPVYGEEISPWSDDPSGEIPTEFDGVIADFSAAKVLPDGNPASDLVQGAQFDRLQRDRREERVRPVQITPASAGNEGNLFSNTVLVKYGGSPGSGQFTGVNSGGIAGPVKAYQETEIVRWDGDGNQESLPCRVAISRLDGGANATFPSGTDASGVNSLSYRPFFHAFWGSGDRGQANEVYGDVGRGVQFTVNASHIYVNVGMDTFTASVTLLGPTVSYAAGAMYLNGNLGFFAGDSAAPVTRTVYIDQLLGSGTATIKVPLFAQALLPPQATLTSGTTQLDFKDAGGNILYSLLYANGTISSPIPIADDVYQITLTAASGGNSGYRLIFQLDL